MDPSVTTALFTLAGVIVGGVLNNIMSHLLEQRRAGWEGKSHARLFAPRMMRLALAFAQAIDDEWTWEDACMVVEANLDDFWTEFAPAFAGTFSDVEWMAVYTAVRPMERLTHTAPRDGTRIT
jgi:hypothetical protein